MGKKIKKQKTVDAKKVSTENLASPKEGIVMHAGASRNELMMTVKERGVKEYRGSESC